jgi:hypothetical protein
MRQSLTRRKLAAGRKKGICTSVVSATQDYQVFPLQVKPQRLAYYVGQRRGGFEPRIRIFPRSGWFSSLNWEARDPKCSNI